MKSKKIIILTVITAIITYSKPIIVRAATNSANTLSSTYAVNSTQSAAKISKDRAKQIAKDAFKNYFDITINDSTSNLRIDSRSSDFSGQGANCYWSISFNIDNGSNQSNGFILIDQITGRIINLSSYTYNIQDSGIKPVSNITEDEAKATAEALLLKIAPEEFKTSKFVKDNQAKAINNQNFNFFYNRLDNNIPVYGDHISVGVDGLTGKVTSYSIQWTDNLNLPSKDGIIDEKKGADLVVENTKMSLSYIPSSDTLNPQIEKETKLVYSNNSDDSNTIDAKTGEVLNIDKLTGEKVKLKDITSKQKEEIYKNYKAAEKPEKTLSNDEAEEIAKEKLKLLYNKDFTIVSSGYGTRSSGINGNVVRTLDFAFNINNSSDDNNNHQICINSSNGEVVDIYTFNRFSNNNEEKFEPKLTSEQAYDKAIQIISKLYPEKIKEIKTEQKIIDFSNITSTSYPQSNIGFNFQRIVNGIPYKNDGINLNFSAKTGELLNLNCNWEHSVSAPATSNIISSDNAKKAFLSNNIPELMYMLISKDIDSKNSEKETKLVYSINNSYYFNSTYIDAFSGKLLNYYGQEIDDNLNDFQSAIKGSTVEKEATILASNGILDTKDFKLEGNITKLQFIKMLTNVKNLDRYYGNTDTMDLKISTTIAKDSTDYKYLQLAVNAGIIDNSGEFKPSDLVTREEASIYLVKLLNYDKIGKLKDAFNFQPTDKSSISSDYVGYVSLAKTLGLIDVDSNNNIRPKDNITMKEVIKAIYNTLQ